MATNALLPIKPLASAPVKPAATPSPVAKQAAGIAESTFTSRDWFKRYIGALANKSSTNPSPDPEMVDLYRQLNLGQLRLGDQSLYVAKNVSGQRTINMFESSDKSEVGISSLANATLEKNQYMLVKSITVLGHVYHPTDVDPGDPLANPVVLTTDPANLVPGTDLERKAILYAPFGSLSGLRTGGLSQADLAIIANGEISIKTKRNTLLDSFALQRFVQDNSLNTETGTFYLDNPILLRSQDVVDAEIELGRAAAANTLLKVMLNGTGTLMV